MIPRAVPGAAAATLLLAAMAPLGAQVEPPPDPAAAGTEVRVVPGLRYRAGPVQRFFNGDNRRDLWVRELTVPVLDLDTFAGGLEPVDRGGNQSKTLHLEGADGRRYIFRSVDKFARPVLPEDLKGTALDDLMQDHISIFHPGAAFVVPRLHEELDLLALPPLLRVMPDHPRLGEYRETFAGMLGQLVERPNEAPHGGAGFAGSHRVVGTAELLDKLEDHPRNRVAAAEYLADRLIDFVVGDTDRGPDQWRWARVPAEDGFLWRPIVRDRDWALMHADGMLARLVQRIYPKVVDFQDDLPDVEALTWADVGLGRRLLTSLSKQEWDAVARRVQEGLTDRVIDDAVDRLPPALEPDHAGPLARRLKARRDRLHRAAADFYARLATDVDVRATDMPDRAEIVRHPDGTMEVTLLAAAPLMVPVVAAGDEEDAEEHAADPYYDPDYHLDAGYEDGEEPETWAPYYRRVFMPGETDEVRVFLHGGDDVAVVRGAGSGIVVRVVGGGGTDVLRDEGRGRTILYDDDEEDALTGGPTTRIDRRPFDAPEPSERFDVARMGYDRHRDWGGGSSWLNPVVDYREGAGVILGNGPSWTTYGFRHQPYRSRLSVTGLVSPGTGRLGADGVYERWLENEPVALRLHARVSQLEAVRFYGYGNASPAIPSADALVFQDRALLEAAAVVETPDWRLSVGPLVRYTAPDVPAANPGDPTMPGMDAVLEAGVRAATSLHRVDREGAPTRGFRVGLDGAGFPAAGDGSGGWGRATGELRGYLAAPLLSRPVLAIRVGGRRAWGDFPIHGAARIGGSGTLRGYRWQRFAGDAAVYGSAELRVPLSRANLYLARGRLGVIGLADAGRVYVDGDSAGDWHTSHGAGLYLETLETAVYGLWARGEEDRFYVGLGLPF